MVNDLLAQVDTGHQGMLTAHQVVLQVLRWLHFFFGIAWLGHLYYFNFVQVNAEKALDAAQKKVVVPNFRGRAMWWFRWGAMLTFLTGLTYILYQEFVASDRKFSGWLSFEAGGAGPSNAWILFGGLLGTIMWFNVWFVIWPRQQVIMAAVGGKREKPADFDALVAKAALFSKINTYLSFPMLFGMGGRSHLPIAKNWGEQIGWWVGVLLVGVGVAVHVVKHAAPKVGLEFLPDAPPPAPPAATSK
ncbi:MAG TPA: urate hydroxylase PuuD [Planctomycetota bacterium]|nr:urate hydroxylase PuuD [Planctomycetota bacterium]